VEWLVGHGALYLGLGGLVGLVAGAAGVGGGFLTTPLLLLCGIPPVVATAAGAGQVALVTWPGILRHRRLGTLDHRVVVPLLAGSIPGGMVGVLLVHCLREAGTYDGLLRTAYLPVLVAAAVFFARPWFGRERAARAEASLSPAVTIIVGFLCGLWAAVLGGGGGWLALAVLAAAANLPVMIAAGTALTAGALTAAHVVLWQAAVNGAVSPSLILLLAVGTWLGGRLATRLAGVLAPAAYRCLLGTVPLAVAGLLFMVGRA